MPSATIRSPSVWPRATIAWANAHVVRVGLAGHDEVAGDLEDVDREPAQVAERRVAGPEVVDRDPDAARAERLEPGDRRRRVVEHRRLGQLEDESAGPQAGLAQDRLDLVDEVGSLELERRDVDAHAGAVEARRPRAPAATCRQASSRTQRPRARIVPFSSASAMNSSGQDQPAGRVAPADERLDARRSGRVVERDDRLVVDDQLAPADAPGELGADSAWRATIAACIVGSKTANASLAGRLGRVHRDVGVAEELVGAVVDRPRARAMAIPTLTPTTDLLAVRPGTGPASASMMRRATAIEWRRSGSSTTRMANSSPPSRAARSLARTRRRIRSADRDQEPVAGGVAQRVVDDLEVVEVEEQHDRDPVLARSPRAARRPAR